MRHRRGRDALEDRGQDVVGADVVREGLERQDEPVAHDVAGHVHDVLGQGVGAAADEGQGPGGEDQVDRRPRAGAERDVALELGHAEALLGCPGGGRQAHGVLDQRRVDVDLVGLALEPEQVVRREDLLDRVEVRRSSARR